MSRITALATVQDLYLIQVELWRFLDTPTITPDAVSEARENLRSFSRLLGSADWRYMGGEDVYETLRSMCSEVDAKIKKAALPGARRSVSKQPRFASDAGKVVAKKTSTKKSASKKPVRSTVKKSAKKATAKKRRK